MIDASVLLAIPLPDPQANKDYAMALLFAIDKGDIAPVLTQLCHHEVAAKLCQTAPLCALAHRRRPRSLG